ncbi:MAG: DeoR/GlpR transcriptional regulator [Clostridia bacterium]|nr:DeoR/GlpR transcriptional regulator [Clostridia bacterium]
MLAKERQNKIYSLLQRNGAVTVANLIKVFDVSIETVRRDLLLMEKEGLLNRVHGGAVAAGNGIRPQQSLNARNKENSDKKRNLAYKATQFISEGDFIFVDTGSTAIIFAEVLREKFSKLTVVTHSVDVFDVLRGYADFEVILCGGHYMSEENAFYGMLTMDMVGEICTQKAFVCPSAISIDKGICDYQPELCEVQKKIIDNADKVFILLDSSKFEKRAPLKISDLKKEYCYISDEGLSKEILKLYKENNIEVYTWEEKK